jgi:beta-glucosidase
MPVKELKAFKRTSISKGAEQSVTLNIPVKELQKWDMKTHSWKIYPDGYKLVLGSNSQDEKLTLPFTVEGK